MILAKALYLIATGVLRLAMLLVFIPILICQAIVWAWRWVELQAVFDGDEDDRRRDEWKGWLYDCTSRVSRGL